MQSNLTSVTSGRSLVRWKRKLLSLSMFLLLLAFALLMLRVPRRNAHPVKTGHRKFTKLDPVSPRTSASPQRLSEHENHRSAMTPLGDSLDADEAGSETVAAAPPLDEVSSVNKMSRVNRTVGEVPHRSCDKCCYSYTTIENHLFELLPASELKAKRCARRLPDAIIIGVKKGGTTTLKDFISYHPDIAFTQSELKFFTSNDEYARGLEHYRHQMAYAGPGQVAMEKTPAYSHYTRVPGRIRHSLGPDVKLIAILRDPIQRAVSDFVHQRITRKSCTDAAVADGTPSNASCSYNGGYHVADTFEESVSTPSGELRTTNQLLSKGVYVSDLARYLKYFRREQILLIDGEAFISDPYPAVKRVERFLGIRDYFTREHFYHDERKGYFCLTRPIPNNCMGASKGRPHPAMNATLLRRLLDYYRPYNKALNKLMKTNFQWSS